MSAAGNIGHNILKIVLRRGEPRQIHRQNFEQHKTVRFYRRDIILLYGKCGHVEFLYEGWMLMKEARRHLVEGITVTRTSL